MQLEGEGFYTHTRFHFNNTSYLHILYHGKKPEILLNVDIRHKLYMFI